MRKSTPIQRAEPRCAVIVVEPDGTRYGARSLKEAAWYIGTNSHKYTPDHVSLFVTREHVEDLLAGETLDELASWRVVDDDPSQRMPGEPQTSTQHHARAKPPAEPSSPAANREGENIGEMYERRRIGMRMNRR